nr:MAG TPA: hypothetical protein [Caudoviricetes sp.]
MKFGFKWGRRGFNGSVLNRISLLLLHRLTQNIC